MPIRQIDFNIASEEFKQNSFRRRRSLSWDLVLHVTVPPSIRYLIAFYKSYGTIPFPSIAFRLEALILLEDATRNRTRFEG
jgi:hypothetical protein